MTMNVVITGANRGIGYSLTKYYVERGENVYAICRNTSRALTNLSVAQIIHAMDMREQNDIQTIAKELEGLEIDLLINNAGIMGKNSLGEMHYASVFDQLDVNAIAPLRLSEALLGNMSSGTKIFFLTSRMGSITDNTSGSHYGYRMSKAALNAMGKSLAEDLKSREIAVRLVHPGFVQTELVNNEGDISADTAARKLISEWTKQR